MELVALPNLAIAGIDEAGRGALIGPLVIAGIKASENISPVLVNLGVKDSKLLTSRQRLFLYPVILRLTEAISVKLIQPRLIDSFVLKGTKYKKLNYLEAITMARIISDLEPKRAYVDAADSNTERFAQQIQDALAIQTDVRSMHRADRVIPVVSAASIIAKVIRDTAIEGLHQRYGEFGSGYPSDSRTIALARRLAAKRSRTDIVRRSWKTWRRCLE
jgi:ribonuclease HII|tara:strand:+ start:1094 stop:1747 length:654 start_codon:yes stop_codon:yes gene_type:complete